MATEYKSKIDWWLLIILLSAMAVSAYVSAQIIFANSPAMWLLAITIGIGIVLPLWILLGTGYTLQPRYLVIRSGPFKWQIPVTDIKSITATSNPLSSPALSLDRLRIEYGRGSALMISPRNKEQFLRDIEALRREAG